MVGNDVVDLHDRDADSSSYSPRFDERVFAPAENRAIDMAADPEACRWQMWSAKEAVYKACRKVDPKTVFSPRRFEVRFSGVESHRAKVDAGFAAGAPFDVRFFFEESAVHAVALSPGRSEADVVHGCERIASHFPEETDSATPGRAVRRLACEGLASALGLPLDELEIRNDGRVPCLFASGRPAEGNLSLSHHGDWVAYAFESGVTFGGGAA